MLDDLVRAHALALYERVNAKWAEHGPSIFGGACGFSVLSGPPHFQPELMIIGSNPGFGADDTTPHVEDTWPENTYIVDADWSLARKLRSIFIDAQRQHVLLGAIQTNFLFFKSSSLGTDGQYPWRTVERSLRTELERWCANEMQDLVRVLAPRMILILGLAAFDQHASNAETVLKDGAGKRRLLMRGQLGESVALGILHPTGCRVTSADWNRVSAYLASTLPANQSS